VAPADVTARIRHGFVPAGTEVRLDASLMSTVEQNSYVIDIDIFVQAPQPFEPTALLAQFTALHSQIDTFFRWSLTEEGMQYFELEEL
jgi:uncharacterized protein (TIGR04255 family)